MVKVLKKFFYRESVQHFSIVLAENILTKGINFILIVLLARSLGPELYGEYSLVNVSMLFLVAFLDFGMENTAVRYSGKYPQYRESIFVFYTMAKAGIYLIILMLILLSPGVFSVLLQKENSLKYIFLIFSGACIDGFVFIISTYLQSLEKFLLKLYLNVSVFFCRLLFLLFVMATDPQNVMMLGVAFAVGGAPVLVFGLGKILRFFRTFHPHPLPRNIMRELLHYSKWLIIGSISVNILGRIDFFMVTKFLSWKEMGIYNSAFQLVAPFTMLSYVFGNVFLPKVSKLTTIFERRNFMRKATKAGLALSVFALTSLFFAKPLVLFLFGQKYAEAVDVLRILLVSFSLSLWAGFISLVLFSFEKPVYVVLGSYLQLFISVVCMWFLIPLLGIYGAAWSKVIAQAVVILFTFVCYFKLCQDVERHGTTTVCV